MTHFAKKLEQRLGRYAIANITLWLMAAQAFFWVLWRVFDFPLEHVVFQPHLVLGLGQWWRVVTFLLAPSVLSGSFLPMLFFVYVTYLYGSMIENIWGTVRLNAYLLVTAVLVVAFTLLGAWLLPAHVLAGANAVPLVGSRMLFLSFFIVLPLLSPSLEWRLFGVIPFKAKWLAWLLCAYWVLLFHNGGWLLRLELLAVAGSFAIFFSASLVRAVKDRKRGAVFRAQRRKLDSEPFHRCCVCNVTDNDEPDLRFAYKNGQGYCERHWDKMDDDGGEVGRTP